jgi:uncharacterized membrane protein
MQNFTYASKPVANYLVKFVMWAVIIYNHLKRHYRLLIMRSNKTLMRLVAAALFAAIIMVVTLIKIPVPITTGAYMNPGDSMIYTCAWLIGGVYAGAAAGIGSMFADLILGSVLYAPATFIIKFLMGLVCALLFKKLHDNTWSILTVSSIGAIIMVLGYGAYEWAMFGGTVAVASLPFNLIQAVGGVIISLPVITALKKVRALDGYREEMRNK